MKVYTYSTYECMYPLNNHYRDCSENKGIYKAAQFDKVLATLGQIDIDSTFSDSTKVCIYCTHVIWDCRHYVTFCMSSVLDY